MGLSRCCETQCYVAFKVFLAYMGFCSKSNKKAGLNFEERKLRVLYVAPPQPPSPIHEGSEEDYSLRASVLDNGNFSAPKFLAAASRAFLEQYEPQYKTTKAGNTIAKSIAICKDGLLYIYKDFLSSSIDACAEQQSSVHAITNC